MVYRNCKVVRKCSQESLIFIGPMMLHGDGQFGSQHHFFSCVNAALNGCAVDSSDMVCDGLVVGSDKELALVNAAKAAFAGSNQLFCMLHCKDNVGNHLASTGIPAAVHKNAITRQFGCSGVSESLDEFVHDDRVADALQYVRQNASDAMSYIQERILPKIAANNHLKQKEAWLGQHQWTNNNCESANHLLKLQ